MGKRRLSNYGLFMSSYLRTRLKPGATSQDAQQAMRDGAAAWRRAISGKNPFPELEASPAVTPETVACPDCGEELQVEAGMAGETAGCPECGATFVLEVV